MGFLSRMSALEMQQFALQQRFGQPPTSPGVAPRTSDVGDGFQGTLIPNKVFIGGLAEKTNERDIREIFAKNLPTVNVKEVKIITDRSLTSNSKSGEPRRYAFVELQNEKEDVVKDDVNLVVSHFSKNELELHGRRLNIGLAYKKTSTFGRVFSPGIASPSFEASPFEALYLQQLFLQQQRYLQQAQQCYGLNPYFISGTGQPMQCNVYAGQPGSPICSPGSPSFPQTAVAMPSPDIRSQPQMTFVPDVSRANFQRSQDARLAAAAGELHRTCHGFVQAGEAANMIRGAMHYSGSH